MDMGVWQLRSKQRSWASLIKSSLTVEKIKDAGLRCTLGQRELQVNRNIHSAGQSPKPSKVRSQGRGSNSCSYIMVLLPSKTFKIMHHSWRYWASLQNQIMQNLSFTNTSNTFYSWTFYSLHTSQERLCTHPLYLPKATHYKWIKSFINTKMHMLRL